MDDIACSRLAGNSIQEEIELCMCCVKSFEVSLIVPEQPQVMMVSNQLADWSDRVWNRRNSAV